jgi:hypothetical protein
MCSSSYKHAYANGKQKYIHEFNFNMLSALKRKYKLFNILYVWEGFCPPYYFHGRAFVRQVIFTGGLLSALLFSREGMERHSCLMLLHFVLFSPKSNLLCIIEVLACQCFMRTCLNEALLGQIFIFSCQNVVLICLNTVLLFQNVMLSCANPVLTCRKEVLICLTCTPSFRIKISICLNTDLFKCGVELSWNCLIMWNSSVILSEVGFILSKCDPGMLWHCCIMLYCRFVLSKCGIDLSKHRHILSDCHVIVFKFGVILL